MRSHVANCKGIQSGSLAMPAGEEDYEAELIAANEQ
jgi:hypothetical protein